MSGTYAVAMGDRGRLVVPADVRDSQGWSEGTALAVLDTPDGVVLMTKDQLLAHLRRELAGTDLVAELLADRRAAAAAEAMVETGAMPDVRGRR